jgi:protein-disulfide isomerase
MNRNLHRRALPVFLAAVSLVFVGCQGAGNTALVPLDLPELQSNSQALVQTAQGIVLGNEDAPVTIVEFADFQCPGCGAFAGSNRKCRKVSH